MLLSRAEQKAAMKKIDSLYQTTPDLTWEDKWKAAEAGLREGRREQMAGIDEAVIYLRRFIVYEGDHPLPNIFAHCSTDQERLDTLLARPSPVARMALDHFSRRTASGRSITSSSDTQEGVSNIQSSSEGNGENGQGFAVATRNFAVGGSDVR